MINAKSGLKNDSICKSLTGITVKEFQGIPPDVTSNVDKGFDGITTEYSNLKVRMPRKKP
ncbi:MAG: hypothetical protein HYY52_00175 [Candidatus Melainabacteria bacterium]|nr:hypothetical protein [Candidatus Melainabacteria bacterium]